MVDPKAYFTESEIEESRRYNRPVHVALLARSCLSVLVFAVFAFSRAGPWLYRMIGGGTWGDRLFRLVPTLILISSLARLPFSAWIFILGRRKGLSEMTTLKWAWQWLVFVPALALISYGGIYLLVQAARDLPRLWPLEVLPVTWAFLLLQGGVGPAIGMTLSSRYTPIKAELWQELRALAKEAGIPVGLALSFRASRFPQGEGAYVAGLGSVRALVLFDTTLNGDPRDVRSIVAHEFGHVVHHDVRRGVARLMLASAALTLALWASLRSPTVLGWIHADGLGDPRVTPFVMFALSLFLFLLRPIHSSVRRREERRADLFALDLSKDPVAMEEMSRRWVLTNGADLNPSWWEYAILSTHPTVAERIAMARRWASDRGGSGEARGQGAGDAEVDPALGRRPSVDAE